MDPLQRGADLERPDLDDDDDVAWAAAGTQPVAVTVTGPEPPTWWQSRRPTAWPAQPAAMAPGVAAAPPAWGQPPAVADLTRAIEKLAQAGEKPKGHPPMSGEVRTHRPFPL